MVNLVENYYNYLIQKQHSTQQMLNQPWWVFKNQSKYENRYYNIKDKNVWKKEKTPSSGWLHSTMLKWKRQYHYAVRRSKGRSKHVKTKQVIWGLPGRLLWTDEGDEGYQGWRKQQIRASWQCGNGEEEIVDKFHDLYSALYNSPRLKCLT